VLPSVPLGTPLPLGWCCHSPYWIHDKRQDRNGAPCKIHKCTRCGKANVWENGDWTQVFTHTGVRVPLLTIKELSGRL
jgi:hypothetical protein